MWQPSSDPLNIDVCVGGERGYVTIVLTVQGTLYTYLTTVFQNVMEANVICWIPGDRRVTVDPPKVKVEHGTR